MTALDLLEFSVDGIPVPQGSKTVFNGHAVDANQKKLKPWRKTVAAAARQAMAGAAPLDGELHVTIRFDFIRPPSVKRDRPSVRPDLDKLVRSVFDALTDAGAWQDDARAVSLWTEKVYAPTSGATIRVARYTRGK